MRSTILSAKTVTIAFNRNAPAVSPFGRRWQRLPNGLTACNCRPPLPHIILCSSGNCRRIQRTTPSRQLQDICANGFTFFQIQDR